MKTISSYSTVSWLHEIAASDLATLGWLTLKLIGLDSTFDMPLRKTNRFIDKCNTTKQDKKPVCPNGPIQSYFFAAMSNLTPIQRIRYAVLAQREGAPHGHC